MEISFFVKFSYNLPTFNTKMITFTYKLFKKTTSTDPFKISHQIVEGEKIKLVNIYKPVAHLYFAIRNKKNVRKLMSIKL